MAQHDIMNNVSHNVTSHDIGWFFMSSTLLWFSVRCPLGTICWYLIWLADIGPK